MATIYGLYDPRNSELRYLGVTLQPLEDRLNCHIWYKDDTYRARWINQLLVLDLKPQICLLEEVPDEMRWTKEKEWIALLRSLGYRLTNTSLGGEGRSGPLPDITKQRMSDVRKGKPKSQEHKEKIRLAHIGKPKVMTEARINAAKEHSTRMMGHIHSEEIRLKIAASNKGKHFQPGRAANRQRDEMGRFIKNG